MASECFMRLQKKQHPIIESTSETDALESTSVSTWLREHREETRADLSKLR